MSGDWIKMRVGLSTNPRVMRLAECLLDDSRFLEWSGLAYAMPGYPPQPEASMRAERYAALRVTRYVTVAALLRFWGYANEHVKGEFIAGVFPEDVDEITGIPGFSDAIQAAGWADFSASGGLTLPNFSEHNTSLGERSSAAERQKRYREKQKMDRPDEGNNNDDPVTSRVTSRVTGREEKRRVEKKDQELRLTPLRVADEARHAVNGFQSIIDSYHAALPGCLHISVLNQKRKKRLGAVRKLAKEVCEQQGWPYDEPAFFAAYWAECAEDPWMRGEVANPNNPKWKQNLDVLLAEDRFAGVMDRVIERMRADP